MDQEIALHFRNELREARAAALKDAEAFEQLIFVFERLGVFLTGSIKNLRGYAEALVREASNSPLAEKIPKDLPDWHAPFSTLYEIVKTARNEAMHEGAYARHLTKNSTELSLILEDALMAGSFYARDFMVRDPVCANMWQPISAVRRAMLINSFSFLPIALNSNSHIEWKLLSDYSVASYLRGVNSNGERNRRLALKLSEAVKQKAIDLVDAKSCGPEAPVTDVLLKSQGRPVLVIGSKRELLGIITPFDVL